MGSVKALNEDILVRLARLDLSNRNAFGSCLVGKRLRDQLGPVVWAYGIGRSITVNHPRQDAD